MKTSQPLRATASKSEINSRLPSFFPSGHFEQPSPNVLGNSHDPFIGNAFAISARNVIFTSAAVSYDLIDSHLVADFSGDGRERVPNCVEATPRALQLEFREQLPELQPDRINRSLGADAHPA